MRNTRTLNRRRKMRTHMTLPEVLTWKALKGRRLGGFMFRRQHEVGPYILDFYYEALKLAVEVDGSAHELKVARDARRDAFLGERGTATVRIAARDVLTDADAVVAWLAEQLGLPAPSVSSADTSPAPQGRIRDSDDA